MKKFHVILMITSALFYACNTGTDNGTTNSTKDSAVHDHDAHDDHSEPAGSVTLNNGEKWIANSETTEGIKKMSDLLAALPADASTEDYRTLKSGLDQEFDMIFEKCTMTGEAHNQLHNYLLPLKGLVEKLESGSKEECRETANQIDQYLKDYDKYFQ